jgi:pimeloyl-ACP methyl ester carboxylesterase
MPLPCFYIRFFTIFSTGIISFLTAHAGSGQLLEYSLVKSFPRENLKAFFKEQHIPKIVLPVNQGLNIYELVYTTTYFDGSTIKASGLLYVPLAPAKALSIMIYNHGTEMCRERSCDYTGEQSICLAFATDEYVVVSPDYIGMGKSNTIQLYMDAATEAGATVDMLTAAKQLLLLLQVKTNKQLFVTGYSQGGHAAMATTRLLQQKYPDEYPVTASAPMSGPYDLESTVYEGRRGRFDYPVFFVLMLQTYFETTQHDIKKLGMVLKAPYDTLIPPLLDGNYPIEEINKLLPDTVFKAVKPVFYADFEQNPNSPFRKFLKDNSDYDWKPEMPMMLSYCNGDEEVTYKNSITAYNTMKRNGAKKVELWQAGKKFGHVNCALFAVVYTKMYFDGFRHGHPGHHGPHFKRLLLNIGKLTVKAGRHV